MPQNLPLLTLVVHLRDGGERRFDVHDWRTVLGRSSQCDIKLVSKQVSKVHAVIEVNDGVAYIRDLGSRNGVEVDGEPVPLGHKLTGNETITLGDVTISVDRNSMIFRSPEERGKLESLLEEEKRIRESHQVLTLDEPSEQTAATVNEKMRTKPAAALIGKCFTNAAGERPVLRMLRIVGDIGPTDTARVEPFLMEISETGETVWISPTRDVEQPPLDGFEPAPNVWVDEPEDVSGGGGTVIARGTYYLPVSVKVVGVSAHGRQKDGRRSFAEASEGTPLLIVPA